MPSEATSSNNSPLAAVVDCTDKIVRYICHEANVQQFATVFKIIRGEHVTAADVMRDAAIIQFYGLNGDDILVDLSKENNSDATAELLHSGTVGKSSGKGESEPRPSKKARSDYDKRQKANDLLFGNDDGEDDPDTYMSRRHKANPFEDEDDDDDDD